MADDDEIPFDYQDSLWIDENIEIALYLSSDKKAGGAPWCASWVRDGVLVAVAYAVTKDRALLKLLRELDVQRRNLHLGPVGEVT